MTDSNNYEKVISLEDDEALKNMDVDNETPYISRSEKDINALMNTVVCNEGEAYKLYNDYAIGVGFSIRRGTTRYHVGTRDISQKEYYCSSEGFSKEVKLCETRYRNRFETRTGCQAMTSVMFMAYFKECSFSFGSYNSNPEFRRLFYKCLQGCETEAEFQATWDRMMDEFSGLRNHKWLNNLYKIREKWCMALNNDVFSGGFKSSQRSESTNNVLNGIANKSISLTKFVLSFEDVVARWRSEEASEDYNCKKGLPSLAIRNSGILNHAAKVYTNKIFKLFQNELLNGIATNWSEIACHDNVYSFEVVGGGKLKDKNCAF
ncbi:hypothetical protein GH714_034859 [Hevea brasiliensis]|uniref:FAR1 domain-containing protein n=1 Tax=Hevea brasiliensis TaxID=3981 RepID=A0A6A6M696_HEVBR|nr:hypothetical protein GH714_034859 [Hevea brasiliensis]